MTTAESHPEKSPRILHNSQNAPAIPRVGLGRRKGGPALTSTAPPPRAEVHVQFWLPELCPVAQGLSWRQPHNPTCPQALPSAPTQPVPAQPPEHQWGGESCSGSAPHGPPWAAEAVPVLRQTRSPGPPRAVQRQPTWRPEAGPVAWTGGGMEGQEPQALPETQPAKSQPQLLGTRRGSPPALQFAALKGSKAAGGATLCSPPCKGEVSPLCRPALRPALPSSSVGVPPSWLRGNGCKLAQLAAAVSVANPAKPIPLLALPLAPWRPTWAHQQPGEAGGGDGGRSVRGNPHSLYEQREEGPGVGSWRAAPTAGFHPAGTLPPPQGAILHPPSQLCPGHWHEPAQLGPPSGAQAEKAPRLFPRQKRGQTCSTS